MKKTPKEVFDRLLLNTVIRPAAHVPGAQVQKLSVEDRRILEELVPKDIQDHLPEP